jgi:hypothetical protein
MTAVEGQPRMTAVEGQPGQNCEMLSKKQLKEKGLRYG